MLIPAGGEVEAEQEGGDEIESHECPQAPVVAGYVGEGSAIAVDAYEALNAPGGRNEVGHHDPEFAERVARPCEAREEQEHERSEHHHK